MAKVNTRIEEEAHKLLSLHNLIEMPVPVDEVAKRMGIQLLAFDLGNDVSGVLHVKPDSASIGYNPNESKVRQRFTVAHEIGHYVLHKKSGNVFIDNDAYFIQVNFRSANSIDYKQEREANAFAAALLMPQSLILREIKNYKGFDLSDNSSIVELAKKFEVSIPAMSFRILNLAEGGLLSS